ncbi:hypothetical protein FIBSPDRAFT_286343 [Athelia psychrophila]|uniref:Mitochondrial ATPase inhibitor n=1 Tax=Athelia psychrophila TaxID=1759441 RepID=A0A166R7Z7_9AGAM|nr:hypothetical protein FIBSPDRAFT_286343 [Fibularhizoctonia sp. CBS 109695]
MLATRIIAARRLPSALVASRQMSSSRSEGSVASSKGFSDKEKAAETEYVRRHEAELLKKLRIEKKTELADLETQHANEATKAK